MVAAAVIGGSLLGAGATIFGASKAADTQKEASKDATDVQKKMFDITQKNLKPYMAAGESALPSLTNFDQAALEATPGYKFALSQGMKAVENSLSARLLGASGAALKGAATFATGLADTTYGEQYNRLLERAKLGENAAAMVGTNATATGHDIAGNIIGAGNAGAAAWNAGAGALSKVGSDIGGYYMFNKMLNPNA